MATQIEQKPLYTQLPVGQEVIFIVSNSAIVSTETKVKFIAEVYVSDTAINISTDTPIGTFKTTPNNAGVGMFDFRQIVESYVSADNLAAVDSEYKLTATTIDTSHPLHLIDKYSTNNNSARYLAVVFKTEYLDTSATPNVIIEDGTTATSSEFTLFNGYLKYTDNLNILNSNFGYYLQKFNLSLNNDKFLTNAPTTQYANVNDYGTLSFLSPNNNVDYIKISFIATGGGGLGSEKIYKTIANGAGAWDSDSKNQLLHFGCFPANLQNWSLVFQNLVSLELIQGGSLSVKAYKSDDTQISDEYIINVNCPNLKGYEPIRLAWLNQWGAWDYYTFNMKSTRMISTKGSTYQQLEGSWNESKYRLDSYKGGKKSFRVNATEKIKINTDFVNESESEWFEELINSPEVYILEGYQPDNVLAALNQYVTPVRLTTSSFTKKTVANDKLMQYTFEVEKSKTLRTQSI